MKINVSRNGAWPRPASASKRNSEGADSGRGVTLETRRRLLTGRCRASLEQKTENGHISTATAEVEPLDALTSVPRWKGPAKQSLRLAAVELDAVGVPVEMIRIGFVERLEERIVGAFVGNHGVVAMAREDGHVSWNTHELIHQ